MELAFLLLSCVILAPFLYGCEPLDFGNATPSPFVSVSMARGTEEDTYPLH